MANKTTCTSPGGSDASWNAERGTTQLADQADQENRHEMFASDSDCTEDDRSDEEIEAVAWELRDLESKFPRLAGSYQLVDRLGEGTFSAVYKAKDLRHHAHDNSLWCEACKGEQGQPWLARVNQQVDSATDARLNVKHDHYVAVKRIYVTSSPHRIYNELEILNKLRHHPNVVHLITAFRSEDQVLAITPYKRHVDFRDFYRTLPMSDIQTYMRCLVKGLGYAHKQGVIHRDVKPANFLYNPATGSGTLCDFGLAESFDPVGWTGYCLHTLPCPELGYMHGKLLDRPKSTWSQIKKNKQDWKKLSAAERQILGDRPPYIPVDEIDQEELEGRDAEMEHYLHDWDPINLDQPVNKKARVGYLKPEYDKRPSTRANRAGTRGFRAPEVLFKCPDQTVAIDVWSVGVILLSFLTRRFPFFQSNDDVEALLEIATIFGRKKLEACGAIHNRTFTTNLPPVVDPEYTSLHELVHSLNPRIFDEHRPADHSDPTMSWYTPQCQLYQAIDLMKKMLHVDLTKRITCQNALEHPFLNEQARDAAGSSEL